MRKLTLLHVISWNWLTEERRQHRVNQPSSYIQQLHQVEYVHFPGRLFHWRQLKPCCVDVGFHYQLKCGELCRVTPETDRLWNASDCPQVG